MCRIDEPWTLEQLLDCCSNPNSQCWQQAWGEFLSRYKKFIYNIIITTCRKYNVPRLGLQFSDTVNDIFEDVMLTLLKNDCRALQNFRARDDEKQFLGYLAVTTHYAGSAHIKKYFREVFSEHAPDEYIRAYANTLQQSVVWMLYDDMVELLRSGLAGRGKLLERNVNIFMMYKWQSLSQSALRTIPCLKSVGERVIEVEAARMLKALKESYKDKDLLRGSTSNFTHNGQDRMSNNQLFGHALAVLDLETESNTKLKELPDSLQLCVDRLHGLRETLMSNGAARSIIAELPKSCCQTGHAFLDGNERFFVARFTIVREDQDDSTACHALAKHLNDCFACFSIFSDVVRYFHSKKKELGGQDKKG